MYKRGETAAISRVVSGQDANKCPGLANCSDSLDVGVIRHAVDFFIRCKI